jgi:iron complex transport system substrate-binding protein
LSFQPVSILRRALAAAALLALAACGAEEGGARTSAGAAVRATDDAGRAVTLPRPATRIIALMPSATETVVALGARGRLVGRTDFDTGLGVDSLPSVGGGLDPSVERIVSLRPDLVIGWETEGPGALRQRLEALGIPVFTMKTEDTTDVFRAIRNLGVLTGLGSAADSLSASIRGELDAVRRSVAGRPRPTVFYLAWHDPPTTAGSRTFVAQVIEAAGGRSAFPEPAALWPTVSLEELVRRQPQVIVVPDAEHGAARVAELRGAPGWRELRAMKEGRAVLVPADVVNRPGPRIGEAARRLRDALHPELAGR